MKQTRSRALHGQVRRLERRLERLHRISYRWSWVRLAVFSVGLLACGLAFYFVGIWLLGIALAALGLVFGTVVYYHRQVDQGILRHQIWLSIKSAHIARMRLDWEHIPVSFGYRARTSHPFESDLDLVGERSLHRLIDTSVSYAGSQRLKDWLTAPVPDRGQILRRQQLVRELVPLGLFRDKLILNATIASGVEKTWDAEGLVQWLGRNAPGKLPGVWLLLAFALAALNAILFSLNRLGLVLPVWQITLLVYFGLILQRAQATRTVFDEAMALQDALRQLGAVFQQLESFSYPDTPHLKALCAVFLDDAHRPSRYLRRLSRVVAAMGLRGNPVVWFVLNAPLPWDFLFAYRLNRHKIALARYAPAWMRVWFELEALSSLANFAYLNPNYSFPWVQVDHTSEPEVVFQARGLGHPLIPDDDRVCNDFTIPQLGRVTIITGSNMTGKSVFLKTVGVNLALAYAGGPVTAQSLHTTVFRMFTSMKVSDSVTGGISYFYAEVKRLKLLLSELGSDGALPLVFLIDEIFRGTNNRERLIGSRAYIRSLVGKHGVGFIATHDLELAKLADQVSGVENYHFRDHFVDGKMVFDYTIRPGPCPTTNALKIMQMEGLPVQ